MKFKIKGEFHNYLELLDIFINEYVGSLKKVDIDILRIGPYNIEVPFKKFFFFKVALCKRSIELNNSITEKILSQIDIDNFLVVFESELAFPRLNWPSNQDKDLSKLMLEVYAPILEPHKRKITYYALHERFLKFMLPVLSRIPHEIVVLCETPIPDDLEYNDNIFIIELNFQWIEQYENEFLKMLFPDFLAMFNNLELYVSLLEPSTLLVIEGNHYQFELLAILGKIKDFPVICLQQGWPGILTTQFKEMEYSHYLSWGNGFSDILRPNNPIPNYISTGYPFKIVKKSDRTGIAFFLQAPILVSNKQANAELLKLVVFCAEQYPDRSIYVREHPQFPVNRNDFPIEIYKNIEFVPPDTVELFEVFSNSVIAISIFSSTLMEAMIYGTIPFIYNPNLMDHYFPNLSKEGLGVEVNSLREAKIQISNLISSSIYLHKLLDKIDENNGCYFASHGDISLDKTARTIMTINNENMNSK